MEPIKAVSPDGEQVELRFVEGPSLSGAIVAKLVNLDNGEVREQLVYPARFPRRWRQTAERRLRTQQFDFHTPQTLITHKKEGK